MIKKNLIKFQAEKELKVPYVKERCVTKERSLIKKDREKMIIQLFKNFVFETDSF